MIDYMHNLVDGLTFANAFTGLNETLSTLIDGEGG